MKITPVTVKSYNVYCNADSQYSLFDTGEPIAQRHHEALGRLPSNIMMTVYKRVETKPLVNLTGKIVEIDGQKYELKEVG